MCHVPCAMCDVQSRTDRRTSRVCGISSHIEHRTLHIEHGFTLVELLVVISIIALLIAILLPSLKKARTIALSAVCAANLHQLSVTAMSYASDHSGYLPQVYDGNLAIPVIDRTWFGKLATYVPLGAIADLSHRSIYLCPTNPKWWPINSATSKYVNYGWNYYFGWINTNSYVGTSDPDYLRRPMRISDVAYPASTILIGDHTSVPRSGGEFFDYGLNYYELDYSDPGYKAVDVDFHLGGGQFLMTDAHVRWIARPENKTVLINGQGGS
ncbi:MAG: type II secretion system protein [Phycisphaerales bacterium]